MCWYNGGQEWNYLLEMNSLFLLAAQRLICLSRTEITASGCALHAHPVLPQQCVQPLAGSWFVPGHGACPLLLCVSLCCSEPRSCRAVPGVPSGLELSCRCAYAEALSGLSCGSRSGSAVLALAICQPCVPWQSEGKHLESLRVRPGSC